MKKTLKARLMAVAGIGACLVASAIAYATVVIDDEGVGFVGKGDVQLAIGGINNAQLQALVELGAIDFRYIEESTVEYDCEWDTVNKKQTIHHSVPQKKTSRVRASIAFEARKIKGQKQYTGFNLNGFETPIREGGVVDCSQDSGDAVPVNIVVGEGAIATFQVSDGVDWYDLPITPVVEPAPLP
jgi:hypothetical protein